MSVCFKDTQWERQWRESEERGKETVRVKKTVRETEERERKGKERRESLGKSDQ